MCNRDLVVVEHAGDDGRAHALAMRLALRGLVDDLVGAIDGVTQDNRLAHHAAVRIDFFAFFAAGARQCEFGDGLHGHSAGDFAGVVAAHAVGEHHQADIRDRADGILVVVPNAAGIGHFGKQIFPRSAHQLCSLCLVTQEIPGAISQGDGHLGTAGESILRALGQCFGKHCINTWWYTGTSVGNRRRVFSRNFCHQDSDI